MQSCSAVVLIALASRHTNSWLHEVYWETLSCRIPFFVAAPTTTLDPSLPDGGHIKIEERPSEEVTHWRGEAIAPASTNVRPCLCLRDAPVPMRQPRLLQDVSNTGLSAISDTTRCLKNIATLFWPGWPCQQKSAPSHLCLEDCLAF